jgi:phosphoglycerate kinase
MGVSEMPSFAAGTKVTFDAVVRATRRGALSFICGGDTGSAAVQMGLEGKVTHISTGGGASLELLEGKTLPGVAALSTAQPKAKL